MFCRIGGEDGSVFLFFCLLVCYNDQVPDCRQIPQRALIRKREMCLCHEDLSRSNSAFFSDYNRYLPAPMILILRPYLHYES